MAPKLFPVAVCAALCLLAAGARADLYRWVDSQGRVHVTDDKTQIPRGATVTVTPTRARPATSGAASDGSGAAPAQAAAARGVRRADSSHTVMALEPSGHEEPETVTHVLRFQRAGQEISLDVALGDRVHCDFKVDTGASLNTIPAWAVKEMGIDIDADTPTISLVGISGKPARVPLVVIPSVRIGTVYVENVEMAVLDTMSSGLLGMPFFNHFQVNIDPAQGELRLTEIDLDKVDGIYGGMGEDAWRQRFGQLNHRLALIRKARDSVPDESATVAELYLQRLDEEEAKVQAQLDALEDRAQAAGVPSSWR
jgi:Aspartyl protease/Domain of unknown function (DUF4124)